MSIRRHREEEPEAQDVPELAALADGSLAPERRSPLEAQVGGSPALADLLAEQERAVALTRSAAEAVGAPAGLRRRIETQRSERRARPPRRLVLVGALAAGVVATVAVGLAVDSGSSGARFQAALGPTDLAPRARGDATLTKTSSGWRIRLQATGLPRLAGGRFYEAWLRSQGGVLVPIGTFNAARNVTLWAGVRPTSFPVLTVTREQADGDQASSGEKVLVGTVHQR
jgi:anti-sigma factor RsiW